MISMFLRKSYDYQRKVLAEIIEKLHILKTKEAGTDKKITNLRDAIVYEKSRRLEVEMKLCERKKEIKKLMEEMDNEHNKRVSMEMAMNLHNIMMKLLIGIFLMIGIFSATDGQCNRGCDLALASYYVWLGSNLAFISQITYDCISDEFLSHVFTYTTISGDTYDRISRTYYANLTNTRWLHRFNSYTASFDALARVNVTVNCSCGDRDHGLFITYPFRE
ncbi:hypothetical protein BUALT_Bualt12G0139800 [Buddleja alternifolia]|uniref:Uncharacterized protein n=1 Tax=Buddleja alternifolia TaxID=168488 RepID=A0AAV6X1Y0_9LAMI|nr:hypothetical protein BUALT_Bualt12G0139800 [Buddleja alternifolia]